MVIGNSMGGMQTWLWAQQYPDFMDIAVPMASLPTAMSGRNWLMRRMIIDAIRNDPVAINSADDERNPPELGALQRAIERIANARLLLIPASEETAGHGTTGQAKFWKREVGELLKTAPRQG